ncbi:MAG: class 1 fructose-bisphosphatase [Actinomycetota bacterium]
MPVCTTQPADLASCLRDWAGDDPTRCAVAATIETLAAASLTLAAALRQALLRGDHDDHVGNNTDGDRQRSVDIEAHDTVVAALAGSAVAALASEEAEGIILLNAGAPLLLAIDPLDGSANLAVDGPVGMIFSIRHAATGREPTADDFLTAGTHQISAGMVLFGPATVLALTVGDGVEVFAVDEPAGCYRRIHHRVRTPTGTREFAINASNSRHWSPAVRSYVTDLTEGTDGRRGADFNMRWFGALVADAYRILLRGGIFLYPADGRTGYSQGRLRMVYEAQPIAMLFEQSGGAATDGTRRILELTAAHLHARTPLVFGSADKVGRTARYRELAGTDPDQAPLFGTRGLFREGQ